jgi:hypothetical protein
MRRLSGALRENLIRAVKIPHAASAYIVDKGKDLPLRAPRE